MNKEQIINKVFEKWKLKRNINLFFNLFDYRLKKNELRGSLQYVKDKYKQPLIAAEVGVARGLNAQTMLKNIDIKKLFLIDSYDYADNEDGSEKVREYPKDNMRVCRDNLSKYKQVKFIYKPSSTAVKQFKDNYFDYVYIDANHNYEEVLQDITSWYEKVKKGGVLAGHNISNYPYENGVLKAFYSVMTLDSIDKSKCYISRDDWWIIK